jgi:2-methylisocitrate lyase-like PEP mutase family enzyme
VYAPFVMKPDEIKAICDAVSKPVNVLAFGRLGLSLAEIGKLGGQRASIGSSLTWTAINPVVEAGERLLQGDFSALTSPDPRIKDWLG